MTARPDAIPEYAMDNGAYSVISAVVTCERQSRDRGWWERMAACFAPDATVRLSWFEGDGRAFVEASRAMSESGDYAVHHLSAPAVQIFDGRALVELPVAIVFLADINGVPATLTSRARMQYRIVRIEGEWLIRRITSIYEYDTLASRLGGELPGVDSAAMAAFRSSYCCLAWYLVRKGYTIADDLLGDDRLEPVASHYRAELNWLTQVTP